MKKLVLFFCIMSSIHQSVIAQNLCQDLSLNVGYFLKSNQVMFLKKNLLFNSKNKKTFTEKVESVKSSIEQTWRKSEIADISSNELSHLILNVSQSVGVDYQILSSIVKKESNYCLARHNKKGGDSGCMQLTGAGINELKHQFGLAGEGKYTEGVPEVLKSLVLNFYNQDVSKLNRFLGWLSSSKEKIQLQIRTGKNQDLDILAGALLLKLYVSIANNNYGIGVRNYNGSKLKFAYQKSVIAQAQKVTFVSMSEDECLESINYQSQILEEACSFSENESEVHQCLENVFYSLPNVT